MSNDELNATWAYHNGTKHPHGALLDRSQFYHSAMRPLLFKVYRELSSTPLPLDDTPQGVPALQAIAVNDGAPESHQTVDLATLTRIFYFSAGITKHLTYREVGLTLPFRAAACTGALYHIELYLVCGDIPGLDAGLYHLDPQGPSIRQLRQGDYRQAVVQASGHEPAVAAAPAILIATDDFGRNAIKYQARAYRHAFWDSGTILANALAMTAAHRLPAKVVAGFVDEMVSRLLDLDPLRELPLALLPIGAESHTSRLPAPPLNPLNLAAEPIADRQIDSPAIRAMHAASSLADPEAAAAWRGAVPQGQLPPSGPLTQLQPLTGDALPGDPVEPVIMRRGSTRRFSRTSISFAQLSTLLHQSVQGVPADFIEPSGAILNELYLTVHAVDGLEPGAYLLRRDEWALELLKPGDFRATSGHLGLDQDLAADATVNIFFLADLRPILEQFGNRGYRAAQLDASIAAGRIYLAAYAQHFGATGLTFYDDAVIDFFSPHAQAKSVMFLIALGHRSKRGQ